MSPEPAPPPPGIRLSTSYERDVAGAAAALLATLRRSEPLETHAPDPERREAPDPSKSKPADAP